MPPTGLYRFYSSGRTMQPHLRPLFNAWAQHDVGELRLGAALLTDKSIGCKVPGSLKGETREDLFVFAEGEGSAHYALTILGDEVTDSVVKLVNFAEQSGRTLLEDWLDDRAELAPFLT